MVTSTTERTRTEKEWQELLYACDRRMKEFTALCEVAQMATESIELDQVLSNALEKVTELMVVEMAAILLVNGHNGGVIAASRGNIAPKVLDRLKKLSEDDSVAGRLALSSMPIVIGDTSKYSQLADISARNGGVRSIAAVPLMTSSRVIGTLTVASNDMDSFTSEGIHLLTAISEGLGLVLRNAQLFAALKEKSHQLSAQRGEIEILQQELTTKTGETQQAGKPNITGNSDTPTYDQGKTRKRTLYQCFNARVRGSQIYCAKGHPLQSANGRLRIERLARGSPLALSACQGCPDYDEMGSPLPKGERGWSNIGHHDVKSEYLTSPPYLIWHQAVPDPGQKRLRNRKPERLEEE